MQVFLERAARSVARRLGYRVQSFKSAPYGLDPWRDVERLAGLWKIDLATAFDVGANIGQSVSTFKKMWPDMRVVCFEPTPTTFAKLEQTVSG